MKLQFYPITINVSFYSVRLTVAIALAPSLQSDHSREQCSVSTDRLLPAVYTAVRRLRVCIAIGMNKSTKQTQIVIECRVTVHL